MLLLFALIAVAAGLNAPPGTKIESLPDYNGVGLFFLLPSHFLLVSVVRISLASSPTSSPHISHLARAEHVLGLC